MKRPFAFLGFSYLLGPLAASFFGDRAILPMLLLFAAALIAALLRKAKNRNLLLALGGISLSLLVCFLTNTLYLHSFQQYDEQKYMLEGEIIELTGEKSGTSSYEVHVQKLNEIPVSFHITLYSGKQLYFTPYDKLHCGVKLSEFKEENGFSFRKSNLSKGRVLYGTLLYDKPVKVISVAKKPPAYLFSAAKHLLQTSIDNFFSGDTADVLSAMLLGEGERISDEVYADFQFSGVNHILVISGMHMAIIAGVVLLLLGKIHIPRKLMLFLGMAAILLYMGMTGFGKSVVRSGIMYCILLLSFLLGEEADALNSLGFSVLLICLINPFSAVDMGFLLSVAATAGIILLAEPIEHALVGKSRIGHFLRPLLAALSVSLAAFTFILPVILYTYGTVNPLSIVTGTILAVPSAALLAVGLIAALVGTVPFLSALMPPLVISVNLLNQFMLWVVSGIGRLGAYLPYFSQESAVLIFIGILGLTAILLLVKPTKKTCLVWGLTVLLLFATGFVTSNWNPVPSVRLVTEDMGQGLFTYLVHGKEAAVLSADGYQTAYADYCLKKQGV
ncbi:MAG: ComEC/Rec2 family competence protein, partial [Oscillospiraceae bacterium]